MIYSILENSTSVSGVSLKNSPNSSELLLEQAKGKGRMTFHTLFPGLTLAFIFVNAPVWPESDANSTLKPLLINYCVSGRSELLLDDGSYIYLKENDFCISRQTAQKEYIFPTNQYQGIKIYFDLALLLQSCKELMKSFSIEPVQLEEKYCQKHNTYINHEKFGPKSGNPHKHWAKPQGHSDLLVSFLCLKCCVYRALRLSQISLSKAKQPIFFNRLSANVPIYFFNSLICFCNSLTCSFRFSFSACN